MTTTVVNTGGGGFPSAMPAMAGPEHKTGGGQRPAILIMDDEEYVRELLNAMIKRHRDFIEGTNPRMTGFEIILAKDGMEALELFKDPKNMGRIMAVVTDREVHHIEDEGDNLIREIRGFEAGKGMVNPTVDGRPNDRGVGIAMFSGTLPGTHEERARIGIDTCFGKPIIDYSKTFILPLVELTRLTERRRFPSTLTV
jgi:CheY-like chemotaxis protein